jgi:tetratricopeptide (TPR) repeat protein
VASTFLQGGDLRKVVVFASGMSGQISSRRMGLTPDEAFKRALAAQHQGNLIEAEKIYRAILKQYPNHFQTLSNLATVLLLAERMEEAVGVLRKALNQEPNSAVAQTLLARALHLLDRHDESLERARRAIALSPGLADAHATLAQALADLGRYDEALRAMARAIELAPGRARFYYYWGRITRWSADDPRFAALEALVQKSAQMPVAEQVELNFALAKAYADCGDIERAFRRQIEGGKLQRRMLRYDEAATLGEFDGLRGALDASWMQRHRGAGDPSPLPVFVLGMPRSGTTLIEQILASHPQVKALGERLTFIEAICGVCGTSAVPPSLAQRAAQWSGADLRRLGTRYLEAIRRDAPAGAMRVIDKLPANFQFVGIIHAALPNAHIIHVRRDPVDTCLSAFSILFAGAAQLFSYDLAELGRYYRAYDKLMAHWRNVLPSGAMLEVQYEEVVEDIERQARRILAYCGLEWDAACLAFHTTDRPIRTISHAQVREPIYRSSVGRARPARAMLLPLLEGLGTGLVGY